MPDPPPAKHREHPWKIGAAAPFLPRASGPPRASGGAHLAALEVTSNFTFLTGASHPEELVRAAADLGYAAIALTDRNSLAGVVRAHVAARDAGVRHLVGARLVFQLASPAADSVERDSAVPGSVLVYPTDRAAYGRLCRLLTIGRRRAPKGACHLALADLFERATGLVAVAVPPSCAGMPGVAGVVAALEGFAELVESLREVFGSERLSVAAPAVFGPDDRGWLARLAGISKRTEVPLVATNDVHYHARERRALQDVLVCIREGCTLDEAGFRLFPNSERCLKPPAELTRLFADHPRALARTEEVAEQASGFSLDEIRYQYPDEIVPPDKTPMQHLVELTWKGADERYPPERYPGGVSADVARRLEHEFRLIDELGYAPYFLTVYDLVRFARSREILCQGRGAAANSAVCYCLGVTAVDPDRVDLLFERFISKERDEPPDIDIDFEHERREEVIQYLYERYGRDRAALTAVVITYRGKSAVRDVGKALGLSLDCIDRLAKDLDWWSSEVGDDRLRELGLDPGDPTMKRLLALVDELLGFPRHLSQHPGGFVMTEGPLCELVPIENAAMEDRTVVEWDKDDIDAMGMLKVDVLALGMLTCVRKAIDLVNRYGTRFTSAGIRNSCCSRGDAPGLAGMADSCGGEPGSVQLHTIPAEDPVVYDMICEADTVGVFQIESRAQMSMLPRLRPRNFYDLVIEVAIVRPGPIQGKMVHPYLRRRNGEEEVTYPNEAVKRVLAKTLGVPLFQEQAMALAVVAAGFTPGKADELRRAMASWRKKGDMLERLCQELMEGLVENGFGADFAQRFYDQIMGFGEYGFPESHAASFALIVYVSCWLKCHHPAAFTAALLNSQPMGFYRPAQLVRDVKEHGVEVREVDVNRSQWDCTLERDARGELAVRLGMRMVKGLRQEDADAIAESVRGHGIFTHVEALRRWSRVRRATLRKLASADAFTSMGLDRQAALWAVRGLRDEVQEDLWSVGELEANAAAETAETQADARAGTELPPVEPYRKVLFDHAAMDLSLKGHPLSFAREALEERGVSPIAELADEKRSPHGRAISVAGIVTCRQRPGTASGILFVTLEDETGIANLIVRPDVFDRDRRAARHATTILVRGRVERVGKVVHLMTGRIESIDDLVNGITSKSRDFH